MTNIWTVAPNVCGFSVWNLLHLTLLAPINLTQVIHFWKIRGTMHKSAGHDIISRKCGFFLQGQHTIMSYSDFSTVIFNTGTHEEPQKKRQWTGSNDSAGPHAIGHAFRYSSRFLNINHRLRFCYHCDIKPCRKVPLVRN